MNVHCPICGWPLTLLEQMLAEHNPNQQCHHCWNRIHATGPVRPPVAAERFKKPRIPGTRRAAESHGRKS